MRTVAGVLALAFLLVLPKANAFSTKSTCKLLNSENNFVDLTDESSSCAESCLSKGKSYAECKCKLKGIPTKPYPSLAQCYKWNQGACCKSGHDAVIQAKYSNLMSTTCIRTFPSLEYFYCLGCNDKQMKYVDVAAKQIKVCGSFAKALWNTADYYQCGLNIGTGGSTVIPEFEFQNSTAFLNHPSIKPPFFSDYEVIVATGDGADCLTSTGTKMFLSSAVLALCAIMQFSLL